MKKILSSLLGSTLLSAVALPVAAQIEEAGAAVGNTGKAVEQAVIAAQDRRQSGNSRASCCGFAACISITCQHSRYIT